MHTLHVHILDCLLLFFRMIEYVDHLHEHFTNPVVMRNGNYQAPTVGTSVLVTNKKYENAIPRAGK